MIIENLQLKKMCLESGINFKTYQLLFKDAIKIPKMKEIHMKMKLHIGH